MTNLYRYFLVSLVFLTLQLSTTLSGEEVVEKQVAASDNPHKNEETQGQDAAADPEKLKAKTHRVERKPLQINAKFDGVFIPQETEEIALRPEVWKEFTVVEAVKHGAQVSKGDVLIRFDQDKIENKIAKDTVQQRLSELEAMELEEDLPRRQRLLEIAYELAVLTHDQLVEDIAYFKQTDRPMTERMTKHRLASSKEDLASQEEELAQLEKMYAADDLTEETEEIVLRRQKFQVETAKLYLEYQQVNHDHTLNVRLPRTNENFARQLEQAKLQLDQAKAALEIGTTREKYRREENRTARAHDIEQHAKLLSDRALMEIRAPCDGIVYYGSVVDGDLAQVGQLAGKLKAHGSVTPGTVLMTIVKPRPLRVQTKVAESDLPDLGVGLSAEITPTADDKLEFPAKVAQLSAVPDAKVKFPLELSLDLEELPAWLVPGMTCKVNVVVYENDEALVVPCDLVQEDEEEESRYVLVAVEGEESERREVEVGRSDGKVIEVLRGLKEGDEIVEEKQSKEDS